jgi:formylglycine-generating enzyme required for sulfatase activity
MVLDLTKCMSVGGKLMKKPLFEISWAIFILIVLGCQFAYGQNKSSQKISDKFPKNFLEKMNFVSIPGKKFKMMQYEVTFEQWDVCLHMGPCNVDKYLQEDKGWGRGNKPAIFINYTDALVFAQWLGQMTGKHYRLPTEEEWEFAARGGSSHIYWWGDKMSCDKAFYGQMTGPCAYDGLKMGTASVGAYQPNPYGLFDMLGNVWEWTNDCADEACTKRILKGGSWLNYPEIMKIDFHDSFDVTVRNHINGFRLVEDI